MSAISSVRLDTLTRSSGQALHILKRAGDIAQRLCCNMGVTRRRAQLGMPEQDLDHPHIRIGLYGRIKRHCRASGLVLVRIV